MDRLSESQEYVFGVSDRRDEVETVLGIADGAAGDASPQNAERLRLALEGAELGVCCFHPASDTVVADAWARHILGSPRSPASTSDWLAVVHPEDRERVGQDITETLRSGRLLEIEYRIACPDGVRWVRAKGRATPPSGRLTVVLEEITARKAREAAMQERVQWYEELQATHREASRSEQVLKVITDALPAYLSYLDPELRYVCVNRTYEEWFQQTSAQIVGKTIDEVLGQAAADRVRGHLEAALTGKRERFEYKIGIFDQERVLSVTHVPDLAPDGTVRGVVVQGLDVTDQKRAEEALIRSEKLAAVGRLAASIAHEINNPLESVTNLLYLARTTPDFPAVQEYLVLAERELRRVSAISNQTLRFYKQSSNPRRVTCDELLDDVLSMYQGRLVNSRVQVDRSRRTEQPVECFDGEVRQVLNNLVGNAIDAMHPLGGRLRLRSRLSTNRKTGQQGVTLTIADTGTGMSPAVKARVFEAFYTTKGIGGTGLGLWVSREIVDRHQGTLRLRSSQGQSSSGTVFMLFLPMEAAKR